MTLFVLNINLQELRQKLYVKINYWLDTLKHFVLRQLKMTMVRIGVIKHYDTVWKLSLFGVFQVRIFPHSNWPQIDTLYLSVFSPNAGKYGLKNFRIWTLLTHCEGPKVLFEYGISNFWALVIWFLWTVTSENLSHFADIKCLPLIFS